MAFCRNEYLKSWLKQNAALHLFTQHISLLFNYLQKITFSNCSIAHFHSYWKKVYNNVLNTDVGSSQEAHKSKQKDEQVLAQFDPRQ